MHRNYDRPRTGTGGRLPTVKLLGEEAEDVEDSDDNELLTHEDS